MLCLGRAPMIRFFSTPSLNRIMVGMLMTSKVAEVRGFSSVEANTFEFPNVPPGEFWLLAVARSAPGADLEYAAQRLRAEGVEVRNLQLATQPGVAVSGRVDAANLPAGARVVGGHDLAQLRCVHGIADDALEHPPALHRVIPVVAE